MDFSKIPLFSAMTRRMTWLGQRQQILAQNIANADTTGYTAQDLKEPAFNDVLRGLRPGVALATTAPRHIGGGGPGAPAVVERTPDTERTTSGNSVVLEDQMMKVSKTVMDFQLTTNLYRKHLAMIKTALGRNGV